MKTYNVEHLITCEATLNPPVDGVCISIPSSGSGDITCPSEYVALALNRSIADSCRRRTPRVIISGDLKTAFLPCGCFTIDLFEISYAKSYISAVAAFSVCPAQVFSPNSDSRYSFKVPQ